MEYIIITPAKNEEKFIKHTLKSVCAQTLQPKIWVIVNDGSTDRMVEIIRRYQQKHHWIRLLNLDTKNVKRNSGSSVVSAFIKGYETIQHESFDFIVKLDADLTLPKNYFEEVSFCFEQNPRVGMCGGYCVIRKGKKYIKEYSPDHHLRGALKAYRRQCYYDIKGLKPIVGWDGLDGLEARYHGWKIQILPLVVIHHRKTNSTLDIKDVSIAGGRSYYLRGNDLFLAFLRSCRRAMQRPWIAGLYFFIGYVKAWVKREPKVVDVELEKFNLATQYNRIWRLIKI